MLEFTLRCSAGPENIDILDGIVGMILDHEEMAHADRIGFAIHELIINSVEAMNGQPLLEADRIIKVKLILDKADCMFSINDRGGGLTESILDTMECETGEDFREGTDAMAECGRGLNLVRRWSDSFQVLSEADGSYTYTLTVHR